jgi:hypothetical protein
MHILLLTTALLLVPVADPAAGASPGGGGGGAPYEALDAGDVFVATITRVEDKGATNSQPPRVWLEVHEVLRGDPEVKRSPAVWSPPFHGIDWGDENVPELKRWKVAPLKGPKVGQKFILGGVRRELDDKAEKAAPRYYLFAFVRIPYTDEAKEQTLAHLKALEEARRKYAAEQAAAAAERAQRAKAWRAALDAETIDQRTQAADAVAIGKIVSGGTFAIETMLKGQPRMSSGGTYYVTPSGESLDPRIADLVYEERPRVVLFLSEKNLVASVTDMHAELLDPYTGIAPAEDRVLNAVKASLKKHPAPEPRQVLVISALDKADAIPLASAAQETFTVIRSQQFSAHGAHAIKHIRNAIPGARLLVMIDRGPQRHVQAVELTADSANTLYEGTWTGDDLTEPARDLAKKLAESVE